MNLDRYLVVHCPMVVVHPRNDVDVVVSRPLI